MNIPRIQNMTSQYGNTIANQFELYGVTAIINGRHETGNVFQSYSPIIAFKSYDGRVFLDREKWDYSRTTGKYRNQFLRESKAETERKIASGEYELADLNMVARMCD